jgi:DNA polymerase/3'-5' exonuclease PolX
VTRQAVNPWRSEKIRRPRVVLQPLVNAITDRLGGSFETHVLGSWRRGCAEIGDLDVLLVTEDGELHEDVFLILGDLFELERGGPNLANGNIKLPDGDLHVDIYACTPKQRGAFQWFLTGPASLNIHMRAAAMRRGWMLNQYGLWADGEQIDNGTEGNLARHLGFERMLPAHARQGWDQPVGPLRSSRLVLSSDGTTTYQVTSATHGGETTVRCTCPGFKYRRNCRHIKGAR